MSSTSIAAVAAALALAASAGVNAVAAEIGEAPAAESPAVPVASETPEPQSLVWSPAGCAAILAEIRDAATGNPIANAKVLYLPRTEAPASGSKAPGRNPDLRVAGRTTPEGSIILPPPGAARVFVDVAGFERASVETPCSDAITVLEVDLMRLPPEKSEEASAGGDAHRRIGGDALETMAGTPRNVFQAVESLPGIARPTFGNALLSSILGTGDLGVRGSRPGESRTYLDGIEIPYFYHYLALSSVIPAEMVEFVDFVPGGAGAQFGRLTGGVVDVHSRALRGEDIESWRGRANLTFWEGNAIARGPVGKGMLSISDRSSIWDFIARAGPGFGPNFPVWGYNDYQIVYKMPTGAASELSAISVGSWDDVAFQGRPTRLHTEFHRAGVSWRTHGDRTKLQLAASYGYDRFLMRLLEPGQGIRLASTRSQQEIRLAADGEYRVRDDLPVRSGVELHLFRPSAGLSLDWEQQEWFIVDRTFTDEAAWGAVWTEAELRPIERVVLIPGVRVDYDTLVHKSWIDPRLTARWFVGDATVLSAAGGLYHRPQPFAVAFADQKSLDLTEGTQVSGGAAHAFGPGLDLDVRLFWNTFQKQVQGVEWFPDFNDTVLGRGHAIGAELLTKFETANGRNHGSLGITAQQTQWKNASSRHQWTASDLDSTWAATFLFDHRMRHNWVFGTRARFYTGLPYTTYDTDVYVPDDNGYIGVGENPYAGRAPAFFQADIRFTKHWILGARTGMEAFLDVQNVTNRANVDRVDGGSGKPTDPPNSMALPLFPSLGVSLTF